GDGNRHAKETSQNAGVDGVTDHGIGTGGDQLVALLNGDGAAPVAAEVLARPDGEQKAADGDGSSQPEGPKANRPELEIKQGKRDASCREEDDRDQEDEDTQDARGSRLEALGGFGIGGLDLPVEKKENPDRGKEPFVEPEHSGPPALKVFTQVKRGEVPGHATFRRPISPTCEDLSSDLRQHHPIRIAHVLVGSGRVVRHSYSAGPKRQDPIGSAPAG